MDIYTVQTALADMAANVVDSDARKLHVYEYVPNSVQTPAWYVAEYTVDPYMTMGQRFGVVFTCRLLVSAATDKAGQRHLAGLLSQTGSGSIFAAVEAARGAPGSLALGGACDDLAVIPPARVRMFRIADTDYYGAEINIKTIGS